MWLCLKRCSQKYACAPVRGKLVWVLPRWCQADTSFRISNLAMKALVLCHGHKPSQAGRGLYKQETSPRSRINAAVKNSILISVFSVMEALFLHSLSFLSWETWKVWLSISHGENIGWPKSSSDTQNTHIFRKYWDGQKSSYGFLILSEYTCILHVSFTARCRYLLRLHGHMSSTEMLLHLEPSEVTKPILQLEVFSFPPSFPTFYNCAVVFMFIKELYVCVWETAPTIRLFEVKALCQVPFTSQHSFPPLFFFFKTGTHTQNLIWENLMQLEQIGPSNSFLCSPRRRSGGKGAQKILEGWEVGRCQERARVNGAIAAGDVQ